MKTCAILAAATMAISVYANGVLDLYSDGDCSNLVAVGNEVPPANGNGGCVPGSWGSALGVSEDSGFVFTVYEDSSCSVDATAVRVGNCVSGSINSFSYDAGS
ncbi:hypothetical protein F5Y16DRAFT_420980 [Xylariaceae sp. FL0255]|nr:hypothetical protein F5Y16DRAFT_420980 [Xylariaceae sp. FL0255]